MTAHAAYPMTTSRARLALQARQLRDDYGCDVAATASNLGIDEAEARVLLTATDQPDAADNTAPHPETTTSTLGQTTATATEEHTDPATELHRGQLRFAKRFARAYGGKLLHAHGLGWHHYDGHRWQPCDDGAEARAVVELTKVAWNEIAGLDKGTTRANLQYDVLRVESAAGVNGVLGLAATLHPCTVAAERLDREPMLLNTSSGTVDLETARVRAPHPEDHLSKMATARFNPDARSVVFDRFLARVQPDPEMRAFLARQLGSALIGRVREHLLFLWYGTGANGKGTLREAIRHALGDYAIDVPAEILLQNRHGQQAMAPERMRLRGARVAFCSEIAQGAQLDEATMKALTGGDPVHAKLLYRNPVEFDPSHTLIMLTNHLPTVRGDDPATWRRILAVPFEVVVPPGERDGELPEKLRDAADAILAWLWAGWLDYQRQGLAPPEAVLAATRKYRHDSDALTRFLEDESVVVPGHGSVLSSEIYRAFIDWCRAEGERDGVEMSNKAFTAALEKREYRKLPRSSAGERWADISLRASTDVEQQ